MKLLLDENLSYRILPAILDLFPDSTHVARLNLLTSDDESIWEYARDYGYIIVSKDSDFHQRSFLRGAPPKVIWLRLGNCTTEALINALRSQATSIARFVSDEAAAFLTIG